MTDIVLDRTSERSLRYAGWPVVIASFVGVMVSFAALVPYTFSLFISPLHAAFGWRRDAISLAFGIAAMTVAACSPMIGHLLDRYPPRRIILPAILLFSAGVGSLAFLGSHIIQFYLSYLLLGIVGNATAQLAYSRAVSTWFVERRGFAFALMLTGSGTGAILLPLIAQHMIAAHGWRAAYATLGILAFVVGFPLTALLMREKPASSSSTAQPVMEGMSIREAMRSRQFRILLASILLYALSANGAIAHLSAILTGGGMTAHDSAIALSVLAAAGIVGRILTGHFLDRYFAPRVSMAMLFLSGVSIVMLAHTHSALMGISAAAVLGFSLGSEADVTPYLLSRYCGLKKFSTLYGLSWTAYAFGASFGPVITGRAYDSAGSYQAGFITLLALPCFVAALLTLFLPRYSVRYTTQSAGSVDIYAPAPVAE